MNLHGLTLSFEITAALSAALVAWKRPEHRPVALFLGLCAVANDLARLALQRWAIVPARDAMRAAGLDPVSTPFTGWARVACDVEGALFLLWPAGLAALSVWLFAKRRPWAVLAAYLLAVAVLVIGHPIFRYGGLRKAYLFAELAALMVSVGAFLRWFRTEAPRLPHVVASCILTIDLGLLLLGPWKHGLFDAWSLAQVMYSALYGVIVILQLGALWITPSLSTGR